MINPKGIADSITLIRVLMGVFLAWLGFNRGPESLPQAILVMTLCWAGDFLDGKIARLSGLGGVACTVTELITFFYSQGSRSGRLWKCITSSRLKDPIQITKPLLPGLPQSISKNGAKIS